MIDLSGDAEKASAKNDWACNAKIHADELAVLKGRARDNKHLINTIAKTNYFFCGEPEWITKAYKYFSAEARSEERTSNSTIAAKLATSKVDAEKKLIAAIELASSGYIICSLAALLNVIEDEDLERDNRLDACILTLESVTAEKFISGVEAHTTVNYKKWNYALKMQKQITSIIRTALELHNSQEKLCNLSSKIKSLIDWAEKDGSPQHQKEQAIAIRIASSRAKTQDKLSRIYQKPVIRSIHHLACTGGAIICKCIASMPETALISEMSPMSSSSTAFELENPMLLPEKNYLALNAKEQITDFRAQIHQALELCKNDDVDLILRDNNHKWFHHGSETSKIVPIRDTLANDYVLISVVTVRHPLDSYMYVNDFTRLTNEGWEKQFHINDLNEYSKKYLAFLQKHSSLKIIRYEEFCADPPKVMNELCEILELEYVDDFIKNLEKFRPSGDNGRTMLEATGLRPKRSIPEEVKSEVQTSAYYRELIQHLGY